MITITHAQARRMIRRAVDTRLPDEQWAELQTHLETCPECAAYRADLQRLEKGVRRALHERWGGAAAAPEAGWVPAIPGAVIRAAQARARRLEWAQRAILSLAGIAALLALVYLAALGGEQQRQAPAPLAPTAAPSPTPTPTALPNFRGQVLFEVGADSGGAEGGDTEIYLLSSNGGERGPDVTNLTRHPARDFAPAWSPDGEWIAFLSTRRLVGEGEGEAGPALGDDSGAEDADGASAGEANPPDSAAGDRAESTADGPAGGEPGGSASGSTGDAAAEGKAELFLMHVAGSRLTQITDLPQIEWEGPLSWSADGRTIALVGTNRSRSDASAIYLVSTDRAVSVREGLGRLPFSNQAGPPRFAPSGDNLAFLDWNTLQSWDRETGSYDSLRQESFMRLPSGAPAIKGFHWQAGGDGLIYTVQNTSQTYQVYQFKRTDSEAIETLYTLRHKPGTAEGQARDETRVRAFSVSPQPGRIAFLQDAGRDGCWTIHLIGDRKPVAAPREIPGLCVDGGLDSASWTADGRWLVVIGHPQAVHTRSDQAPWLGESALYAVQTGPNPRGAVFERLGDWSARLGGTGETAVVQVRPSGGGGPLGIQPHAATPALPLTQHSEAPGRIAMLRYIGDLTLFIPGVLGYGLVETARWEDGGDWACPSLSPDGQSVSFLHSYRRTWVGGQEVFADIPMHLEIHGSDGRPVKAFEYEGWGEKDGQRAYCPVWSPDGRWIATPLGSQGEGFVLALHATDWREDFIVPLAIDDLNEVQSFLWAPDGQSILLGVKNQAGEVQLMEWRIADLLVPTWGERPRPGITRAEMDEVDYIYTAAVSPDGKRVAFLILPLDGISNPGIELRILDAVTGEEVDRVVPEDYDDQQVRYYWHPGRLYWFESGIFGFFRRNFNTAALTPYEFLLYDPAARELRTVLYSDMNLWDLHLSPDGNWLAYTTPDALWLLDLRGPHEPVLLLEGRYELMDWR